jgi:DNA-binding GntR family transcriptional regulator
MKSGSTQTTDQLLKNDVADWLRTEIMRGTLRPRDRIVEGTWAARFGVAQASIREAINILTQEGFVNKRSGRSARVVHLSEDDVSQLYQIRGALEGLAARLTASSQADLSSLQIAVDGMREAVANRHREALLDCDLQFHLRLCEASGNQHLLEYARRILLPFFAFVRMRVTASNQEASVCGKDLEAHQRIIDLIREGEGDIAQQYLIKAMARFARTAYDNWENRVNHDR